MTIPPRSGEGNEREHERDVERGALRQQFLGGDDRGDRAHPGGAHQADAGKDQHEPEARADAGEPERQAGAQALSAARAAGA